MRNNLVINGANIKDAFLQVPIDNSSSRLFRFDSLLSANMYDFDASDERTYESISDDEADDDVTADDQESDDDDDGDAGVLNAVDATGSDQNAASNNSSNESRLTVLEAIAIEEEMEASDNIFLTETEWNEVVNDMRILTLQEYEAAQQDGKEDDEDHEGPDEDAVYPTYD